MAVTSLWRVKGYIGKVVLYAMNPEKTTEKETFNTGSTENNAQSTLGGIVSYVERDDATNQKSLVYGIMCHKDTAVQDMMAIKNSFKKTDGVIAYHGYQSFAEGEVTPDTAHEIGKALAKELWGDRFQVLVTTHLDKDSHIHNHFVINTVSFVDGKKFHRTKEDYYRMREVSDQLCKEYGLSVIRRPKQKGMNYAEWQAEKNGQSTLRGSIREAIDLAEMGCTTEAEFLTAMDKMGFIIDRSGKHAKIKHVGDDRFVRFKSLGEGYSYGEIIDRVYENDYPEAPSFPEQESPQQVFSDYPGVKVSSMRYTAVYHCYCKALVIASERPRTNRKVYALVRQDATRMQSYSDQNRLLSEHHIDTPEQLRAYKQEAMNKIDETIALRQDMRNALKRAERSGDSVLISKIKFNIDLYSRQLKKLRREVAACDGVMERVETVREKLFRIEEEKFRGKEKTKNEHISRSSRPDRENES